MVRNSLWRRAGWRWCAALLLLAGLLGGWLPGAGVARAATTIVVTTTGDAGGGSLRQAIADATAGDTITFAPALNGQAITLTTAELLIAKNLTITGPEANLLTVRRSSVSGTPAFRIFNVTGGTVAISGLTVTGGSSDNGAGIFLT